MFLSRFLRRASDAPSLVLLWLAALGATAHAAPANDAAIAEHYADLGAAVFADALDSARQMQQRIEAFLQSPDAEGLTAARQAWLDARVPYQQSEVFRFSHPVVDEWEGRVNAWPLDEGLIDYVAEQYQHEMGNIAGSANIVANRTLTIAGTQLSLDPITPDLLRSLHELGGSEANVATGYHAIEFLLWGQDLNGTGPGAGARPYSDYAKGEACTHGNCERRAAYLQAVVAMLVEDLAFMSGQWQAGVPGNYRQQLLAKPNEALEKIVFGMGSLALGELAGERMKVALEAESTEDEHDCFSDNTHNSHYYNLVGIENVFRGRYKRIDGKLLEGPALADRLQRVDRKLYAQLETAFDEARQALGALVESAERPKEPQKFDQLIALDNPAGRQLVSRAITELTDLTGAIEAMAARLKISGSL